MHLMKMTVVLTLVFGIYLEQKLIRIRKEVQATAFNTSVLVAWYNTKVTVSKVAVSYRGTALIHI